MKLNKILSAVLALLMVVGIFASAFAITASAAPLGDAAESEDAPTKEVLSASSSDEDEEGDAEIDTNIDYTKLVYASAEEKLADMKLRVENDNFELYAHPRTGEVGLRDKHTGQILLSNPYDIASSKGSDDTKASLMSQIIIEFTANSKSTTYNSYTEAAIKDQITLKNIKNGLRVEYTIGRLESRKLVPRWITAEDFETYIMQYIRANASAFINLKFESYYSLKDASDPELTEASRASMFEQFPITRTTPIYVSDANMSDRELNMFEGWIKTYCPDVTYELLEEIHDKVGYEAENVAPPCFRMAIEYTLDDTGLVANLAANAIRFNETAYQLKSVQILPFFGAGNVKYTGFTFIPDGSGTITRFEDISSQLSLLGKVYGSDYAYHTNDPQYRQSMRLPVFGVVENFSQTTYETTWGTLPEDQWYTDEEGYLVTEGNITNRITTKENKGYFAILMEGDSMAEISSEHGGVLHNYNSVQTKFYPRPTDQYNLADAVSVGTNAVWTVTSDRKYSGNYKIKYVMLNDETKAEEYKNSLSGSEKDAYSYYSANLMGMVNACRDYYESNGTLTRITEVKDSIPLAIETLGTISTTERILSIPVTVTVPLATFDNIKTMTETLKSAGITNINYKLTGFANGIYSGLYPSVPSKVKWEKKAGGADGFKDLMQYAEENDVGIYPEFEFSYVGDTTWFDSFSYRKHAAKTMDDRYARKREYDPAFQAFFNTWYNPISPSVFEYFYDKMSPKLLEYAPTGISVSSLGSDLNSDFDNDDPYNREDSKKFVSELLARMQKDYGNVMVGGGNAYALPYVNYILEVPLDSSQYLRSSASVPFLGMVLHGYKTFAGSPLNMSGDIDYDMLKIIENGASPYFLLCYQNTEVLKDNGDLQKYYSVGFDVWLEELVEKYQILNDALKDVQDKLIINYEFLTGERVVTAENAPDASVPAARAEAPVTEEEATASTEEPVTGMTPTEDDATEDDPTEEAPGTEPSDDKNPSGGTTVSQNRVTTRIVRVTYEGGKTFILNYNNFSVIVDGVTVDALSFAQTA